MTSVVSQKKQKTTRLFDLQHQSWHNAPLNSLRFCPHLGVVDRWPATPKRSRIAFS